MPSRDPNTTSQEQAVAVAVAVAVVVGGGFFVKFILLIVTTVGGYLGWVAYRTQKRNSR